MAESLWIKSIPSYDMTTHVYTQSAFEHSFPMHYVLPKHPVPDTETWKQVVSYIFELPRNQCAVRILPLTRQRVCSCSVRVRGTLN